MLTVCGAPVSGTSRDTIDLAPGDVSNIPIDPRNALDRRIEFLIASESRH